MNKNAIKEGNMAAYPDPSPEHLDSPVGLTKREYFAAMAMQGILANTGMRIDVGSVSRLAVKQADALLNELHPQGTATDFDEE
jgi:hypothetical protein